MLDEEYSVLYYARYAWSLWRRHHNIAGAGVLVGKCSILKKNETEERDKYVFGRSF